MRSQAEDGIRDPLWSRGLGDVYKRQFLDLRQPAENGSDLEKYGPGRGVGPKRPFVSVTEIGAVSECFKHPENRKM